MGLPSRKGLFNRNQLAWRDDIASINCRGYEEGRVRFFLEVQVHSREAGTAWRNGGVGVGKGGEVGVSRIAQDGGLSL